MDIVAILEVGALSFSTLVLGVSIITGGVTEAFKRTTKISKIATPWTALAIGILVAIALAPFTDLGLSMRVWAGFIGGGTAVGLFELGKTVVKGGKTDETN